MKTCLVVDDSSIVRKIARQILEPLGFQIVEAEDGEKALEACKRGLPDAILLDWNMPVMDGYEFLGHLRRLPGGDAPKVVFCTTENGIGHISRALSAGADEYIMKPFDKDIVADKFQEVGFAAACGQAARLNPPLCLRPDRDPARVRISAQVPQRPFRSRSRRRQAVSD